MTGAAIMLTISHSASLHGAHYGLYKCIVGIVVVIIIVSIVNV
jgi:hypothetical protein